MERESGGGDREEEGKIGRGTGRGRGGRGGEGGMAPYSENFLKTYILLIKLLVKF
jgi:hypothetical protein